MTTQTTQDQSIWASGVVRPISKKPKRYTIVRIGIWTCLVTFSVGVLASSALLWRVYLSPSQKATAAIQSPQVKIESFTGVDDFARTFAYYWLTGDLADANKFTAKGFSFPADALQVKQKMTVKWVQGWDAVYIGDNRFNVTIEAVVLPEGEQKERRIYFSVPVVAQPGGSYGVYGFPVFVPAPKKPTAPVDEPSGSVVDQQTEQQIRFRIDSFFRYYFQGQSDDLSLLFADQKPRSTLYGQYLGLENVEMYGVEDKVEVYATARAQVEGIETKQIYKFVFIKSGSQWMIDSTTPPIPTK